MPHNCPDYADTVFRPNSELNIKDAILCSPSCFKDNDLKHKKIHLHQLVPVVVEYAPGTKDPFGPTFKYTGSLRAMYPTDQVPKRALPTTIARPDYADNAKEASFAEKVAARQVYGTVLTEEEQKVMREVCRLGREHSEIESRAV